MTDNKTYCVYRHITPSGKIYIGITRLSLQARWRYGSGYKHNPYFFRAIEKYGWDNIKHEVLLEGLTKEQAELAERLFIGYWDSTNRNKGYNIEGGGNLNKEVSDETRKKMSESKQGNKHPWRGRRHTEESKRKMSKSHTGKNFSDEHRAKLSKANSGKGNPLYGKRFTDDEKTAMMMAQPHKCEVQLINARTLEVVGEYSSVRDAERQTGVARYNIRRWCKRPQMHKYESNDQGDILVWVYKDEFEALDDDDKRAFVNQTYKHHRLHPVRCIELNEVYESVTEAAKCFNITYSSISACCNRKQHTAGGYHWEYCDDST